MKRKEQSLRLRSGCVCLREPQATPSLGLGDSVYGMIRLDSRLGLEGVRSESLRCRTRSGSLGRRRRIICRSQTQQDGETPPLPAAPGDLLAFGHLGDVAPDHRLAQVAADFGQDVRITVMGDGFNDRRRAPRPARAAARRGGGGAPGRRAEDPPSRRRARRRARRGRRRGRGGGRQGDARGGARVRDADLWRRVAVRRGVRGT